MKLLFAFLFALSILGYVESACLCYANQTYPSTIAGITISSPTETGAFGSPPCAPIQCTTVVTFTGNLNNSLPAGAQISIVSCSNLSTVNTIELVEKPQTFSSCPSGVYKFNIDYSSTFTFKYNLATPISFTAVLQPILRVPATTVAPPAPTTPMYAGPFPSDPAISTIDLVIGLDTNNANQQFYTNSKEVITNIVKYFTYLPNFVRLSFMTFDPFAAGGTGKYPLWSHNMTTVTNNLNDMPFYPGNTSKYSLALDTYFFTKLGDFPLRQNIERVFIIFTGTDGDFVSQSDVQADINQYDIKFIFVNLNTAVSTTSGPGTYYQNLALITGTGSNKAHWYDYQTNQNNAENILSSLYFNGNVLCNVPASPVVPVTTTAPPYSVPLNPSSNINYCNYMNDVRTYANPGPTGSVLQVYFSSYDLSNEKDVIRIGVNGTEVSVLTGQYGSAFYCIPGSPITVTFQSKNGLIYNGYQVNVKYFADGPTCKTNKPSQRAAFIDHTKRH
jgi:hypothetical protein|uniref:VWFA domain-containing protein n=1 Tax=Panagrolaimus davidi TaxID=227884 RepID=A0A914Q5J8_9BILA